METDKACESCINEELKANGACDQACTPQGRFPADLSCQESGCFSSGSSEASILTSHVPATPVGMDVKHGHLAASSDKELDAHMFGMQENQPGRCFYLESTQAHSGMTPEQRAAAIDTMVAAAAALGLHSESLFTAVACFDAYLAAQPTHVLLLQPLGVACLWLAAKYEQLCVPSVHCFAQFVRMPSDAPPELQHNASAPQQLLVLLESALAAARAAGRPYAVSEIYASPAALYAADVAPLQSLNDPRLLA
ncbi:hypothetical protein OEZ86_007892 [Tetradesmus obliquus]|nr:hypothetical protein OEZ86_007892 [Tetradesmus obliquus]